MTNYGAYAGVGAIGVIALIAIWRIKRKCRKEVKVYGDRNISRPSDREQGSSGEQTGGGSIRTEDGVTGEREQISEPSPGRSGESGEDGRREEVQIDSNRTDAVDEQTTESDSSPATDSEQDSNEEEEDSGEEEIEIPDVD